MEYAAEKLVECKLNLPNDDVSTVDTPEQASSEHLFKWPHEAILLLIEEYRKFSSNFYSGRLSHKKIWQLICEELKKKSYIVTGPQCQSKFTGLKRTYKGIKDHNGKSGNGTKYWPYFDLLDDLMHDKPCITPIATASSTAKRFQPESESASDTSISSNHPKKKTNSPIDKVVMAIEENRRIVEENREKRHREKMEQKNEALGLLARLVNVLEKKKD